MTFVILVALAVVPPTIAVVLEFMNSVRLSERHHSHHDTYGVSIVMLSVLVMAMVFMGLLGLVLSWLCYVGVFHADGTVMLGFFSSFVLVMFVMWMAMRRYHVSTYDDYMVITPYVGKSQTIHYDKIERLRWSGSRSFFGDRSLSVIVGGKVVAVLVGVVDIEQILQSINRTDILDEG